MPVPPPYAENSTYSSWLSVRVFVSVCVMAVRMCMNVCMCACTCMYIIVLTHGTESTHDALGVMGRFSFGTRLIDSFCILYNHEQR